MELLGEGLQKMSDSKSRYRRDGEKVLVDIAVKSTKQLFDARDPAPFRERDLDDDLVKYLLSLVDEFPLTTPMKLIVHLSDEKHSPSLAEMIVAAMHAHFVYESDLLIGRIQKTLRMSRTFFAIGLLTLALCLTGAEFVTEFLPESTLRNLVREGLVIVGWVAMWRPVEAILYDWWPLRELKQRCDKLASVEIEVRTSHA